MKRTLDGAEKKENEIYTTLSPNDPEIHMRIRDHGKPFELFHYRVDATAFSDHNYNGYLAMFGKDRYMKENQGKKQFISASFDSFWNVYAITPTRKRCFYEIFIPGNGCHLYMDIDVCRTTNVNIGESDFMEMECKEIIETSKELMIKLGFVKTIEDVQVIILDSSNDRKFSRHLIFKMTDRYFADNYHCGAFARTIQHMIIEKYGKIDNLDNPFFKWRKNETKFTFDYDKFNRDFVIDLGVYTQYRQFRLIGSSKWGEIRPLHLLSKTEADIITWYDFIGSLATNVDLVNSSPINCCEVDGSLPCSTSNKRLFRNDPTRELNNLFNSLSSSNKRAKFKGESISDNHEIFSAIEKFIQDTWNDGFDVRCKAYVPENNTIMVETFSKNCHIKGSPHKSNNISFIVYLKKQKFYQRCLDPDPPCCFLNSRIPRNSQIGTELRERLNAEKLGHEFSDELKVIAADFLQSRCIQQEQLYETVDVMMNMWAFYK